MAETFAKFPPNLICTLDRHDGVFMMLVPPVVPPAPLMVPGIAWHIGFATEDNSRAPLGTNKWNDDVKFDGFSICSRGNSAWPIIPHWNIIPAPYHPLNPNVLIPALILASKSKSLMAVGGVVAKKGPIAVTIPELKVLGINNACNDPVCMPTDMVIHTGSSVLLGFTLGDLVAVLIYYGIDCAIDQAGRAIGKKIAPHGKRAWTAVKSKIFKGDLAKRIHMNLLGKLKLPQSYKMPDGAQMSRILGIEALDGAETKVAETLIAAEGKAAISALKGAGKSGAQAAYNAAKDHFRPGYRPNFIDKKIGEYIDGRSPPALPPPPASAPSHGP